MDSINNILLDKNFDLPPEVITIKAFVQRYFKSDVAVKLGPHAIVITAPSAALAGSLRMQLHKLKEELGTDKRLVLRIGH